MWKKLGHLEFVDGFAVITLVLIIPVAGIKPQDQGNSEGRVYLGHGSGRIRLSHSRGTPGNRQAWQQSGKPRAHILRHKHRAGGADWTR